MFLYLLYAVAGIFLLGMAFGLWRRSFWHDIVIARRASVRLALFFFGAGLLLSSMYQAWVYYAVRPAIENVKNGHE